MLVLRDFRSIARSLAGPEKQDFLKNLLCNKKNSLEAKIEARQTEGKTEKLSSFHHHIQTLKRREKISLSLRHHTAVFVTAFLLGDFIQ